MREIIFENGKLFAGLVGGLGWVGLGWVSCGLLGPFQPEVEFTPKARRCDQCVWACRIPEVFYLIHP